MDSIKQARIRAGRYLARREYCQKELVEKLSAVGVQRAIAQQCVAELAELDLVSDARFAKSLVEVRARKGYGPLRIADELRRRGVGSDLISSSLNESDSKWTERLSELVARKYGDSHPEDFKQWAKRSNFLRTRGFTSEQINQTLGQFRREA